MLLLEHPDRIRVAFDDHRLVANAGLVLPGPDHRSRRWWSPGRWSGGSQRVRPQRPRPGPVALGSPGPVGGRGPQRKLRRKVPRVVPRMDGALTVPPRVRAVPPARNTSASSMQSPPARAEATRVITLSPVPARLVGQTIAIDADRRLDRDDRWRHTADDADHWLDSL